MIRIGERVSMFFLGALSLSTLFGVYHLRLERRAIRKEQEEARLNEQASDK